jgi:hypothetical protein
VWQVLRPRHFRVVSASSEFNTAGALGALVDAATPIARLVVSNGARARTLVIDTIEPTRMALQPPHSPVDAISNDAALAAGVNVSADDDRLYRVVLDYFVEPPVMSTVAKETAAIVTELDDARSKLTSALAKEKLEKIPKLQTQVSAVEAP